MLWFDEDGGGPERKVVVRGSVEVVFGLPVPVDDGDVRGWDVREAGSEDDVVDDGSVGHVAGIPGGVMMCPACGSEGVEHTATELWGRRARWWRCLGCCFVWAVAVTGERVEKDWERPPRDAAPGGTLPVRGEKPEAVCMSCGGKLVITGEKGTWKECGVCGFGWGLTLAPAEWTYKRMGSDGVTRFIRIPYGTLFIASFEEAL